MTHSRPVARVVDLLLQNGYQALPGDLQIGTLSFDFEETLVGTQYSFDLVVITDTIAEPREGRLRRKIEALARALDMVESRRSFTLVLVGPEPTDITMRELSRVCRVLAVGTPTGDAADNEIRDVLAVLLPLNLPQDNVAAIHPLDRLRKELQDVQTSEVDALLDASAGGSKQVTSVLRAWLVSGLVEELP